MSKLSNFRADYYVHTGNASAVARQAAFAGIALIWIFSDGSGGRYALPRELLWPSLFLLVGLGFDLLQYVVAAAIWGAFHRLKEKELGAILDPDVAAPPQLNWPALFFFWTKLVAVIAGYVSLLIYVKHAIKFTSGS